MIVSAIVDSFLLEILQGIHQPGDEYRIALYLEQASLGAQTKVYTPLQEVNAAGYKPGGQKLTGYLAKLDGPVALLDWEDPVWPNASITARGALIFNFTKGNRAVVVMDLGKDYVSTNGEFKVFLPEPTAETAVVRIG